MQSQILTKTKILFPIKLNGHYKIEQKKEKERKKEKKKGKKERKEKRKEKIE